eukprot:8323582-Lingulodinium_polyedra.AAC.1
MGTGAGGASMTAGVAALPQALRPAGFLGPDTATPNKRLRSTMAVCKVERALPPHPCSYKEAVSWAASGLPPVSPSAPPLTAPPAPVTTET